MGGEISAKSKNNNNIKKRFRTQVFQTGQSSGNPRKITLTNIVLNNLYNLCVNFIVCLALTKCIGDVIACMHALCFNKLWSNHWLKHNTERLTGDRKLSIFIYSFN